MNALRPLHVLIFGAILASCSSSATPGSSSLPPAQNAGAVSLPARPAAAGHRAAGTSYLYVENGNSTIDAYAIGASGALTLVSGSPYNSNTNSPAQYSIAVDPKGPYLLVTGTVSQNVASFTIGSDGTLTPLSDSTNAGVGAGFPLLNGPDNLLYVINDVSGGSIAAFKLANKTGKLKAIGGSPFPVSCPGFCTSNPSALVMNGSYLYSVDTYGWYVSTFSVAPNGALTELNSYATHYGPSDAVMTPNGADLYVTNGASADISAYSVAGGVLTQITGSPFPAGGTPQGITITADGKFVYVANQGDGTISGYSVGSGGALAALPGSPFADGTGTSPTAITVDKRGKHLFVTNGDTESIAVYAIARSGALAQIAGSPFPDPGALGPRGIAIYQP